MRFVRLFLLMMVILAASSGCSGVPTLAPMPTLPVGGVATGTAVPSLVPTSPVLPTETAASGQPTTVPALTPTPFTPFAARVAVDNLNLRVNPGHLSPVIRMLPKDTPLTVLGKAPGGEWISVKTAENVTGWVFWQLLSASVDVRACPVIQPEGVQIIRGQLRDAPGNPINGVQFALQQGDQRTDAVTDEEGMFYAFFPETASGEWTASYAAISCESRLMDANCNCIAGACAGPSPAQLNFSLPFNDLLQFTWK